MQAVWQKKNAVFWTTFFLIDPWSWCICIYFGSDCSIFKKQDSRYWQTYVYIVHKGSLLKTTSYAVYSKDTSIEKRQRAFFRRLTCRINYFWIILWWTSNLIWRPIKKSSLKSEKSKGYSCRCFEVKEWWGMHSDVAVLKLKSNESESAKKKCTFLDYFFFNRSLKLVHQSWGCWARTNSA